MEIVLNCGDKINIPDGCKAEIKDGVITIEKKRMETPRKLVMCFGTALH